jgi:arabinofuranan 3-O-arabinosyltransferase
MERPKVSIIVPTYNSARTLTECLTSIRNQTHSSYEVVIVDNFSTDHSLEIAKEFKAKIIRKEGSAALARNIGVANSTGQYLLFLDSDQALSPMVVEECIRNCSEEKAGMVRIPEIFIGKGFWGSCSAVWKNYHQKVEQLYGATKNILSGEPRFFARAQISRFGMFDTALVWGEDYDLYERLRKAGLREAICKSSVYHYELASLRGILVKNLHYGKYMPTFIRQTQKDILPLMVRHALLTLREVSRDFWKSPATIVGCVILLCLKAYAIMVSSPVGLLIEVTKG